MNNPEDNLGICYQCRCTFCPKCKEAYHFQAICPEDFATEQLKLRLEKERRRMERKRDEALAKRARIKEESNFEERRLLKEEYRSIAIKLSEQDALLQEVLSAKRIDLLNTRHCPQCHVRIEKMAVVHICVAHNVSMNSPGEVSKNRLIPKQFHSCMMIQI